MLDGATGKLAIEGGLAVRTDPLPPWPAYSDEEIEAAARILRSGKVNYWTGDECRQFELEFADFHGAAQGIALANGTLALELALRILDIGPGDEVIVTPRSYFASASCIVVAGATPVFADIDFDSQNITADSISEAVTPRTKAIIAVHLAGWPCDMPGIMDVAKRHNLFVIEDCAQAHGARIDGKYVGTFGDVAAFSFCQDKIMSTAGEGGMLLTNDKELWAAAWSFKDHGKSWEKVHSPDHPLGFRWLHDGFGSNYRMTEIQGAIGRIQLRKLDSWVSCRRKNAGMLISELDWMDALRIPRPGPEVDHAYYKFYAFVQPHLLAPTWNRDRILESLAAEGIPGLSGSCPEIYREAAFEDRVHPRCPVAKELGVTSIALLVHPTLDKAAMDCQATAVKKVLALATRKVP